ncbi:hypothetical protein GCM10009809_31410 [Isoptericola hypogeus]|uniref:DUF2231 domain-containing protein n=1 Tax=Isoptericola hypogeus TaxID=300179 RepID=A0ABN2JNS1_9MICO
MPDDGPLSAPLARGATRLETEPRLDPLAQGLGRLAEAVVPPPGRLHDELRGRSLGHPAHAVLTDLPLGLWIGAAALDVTRPEGHEAAARRLVGLGLLSAAPTVLAGLADFRALTAPARRVAAVHAAANATGNLLVGASWWARRSGRHRLGRLLTAAGLGAAGVGGYLGGHIAQTMREPVAVPDGGHDGHDGGHDGGTLPTTG